MRTFWVASLHANPPGSAYRAIDPAAVAEDEGLRAHRVLDDLIRCHDHAEAEREAKLPRIYWHALMAEEARTLEYMDRSVLHSLVLAHLQFLATILAPEGFRTGGQAPRHLRRKTWKGDFSSWITPNAAEASQMV